MIVADTVLTLKDGRTAILRSGREEDARGALDYLLQCTGESEFVIRYPDECDFTEESERAFFAQTAASPNELALVALIDGKIVGTAGLHREPWRKVRHRADVAIALLKNSWGLGLGTAMLSMLIDTARTMDGLELLELSYVEGNARASALYEKLGFRATGIHRDAYRLSDGRTCSEIMMTLKL